MTGTIMILGAGPSGVDIASALSVAGRAVTIVEPDPYAAERAGVFLARRHDPSINRAAPKILSDIAQLRSADFVFEALDEPDPIRTAALHDLARHLPNTACVALTNLSDLGACDLPNRLKTRVLGFQMCAPAFLRQLVEIASGPDTNPKHLEAAFDLARAMGKAPVTAPAGRPPIGTRLQRRLYDTADTLLMEGANPFELDDAMVAFGFDMGLYAAQDLIGLDVAFADRRRVAEYHDPARRTQPISDRMVQEGRLGKKVGVGWYRYPGGGGAVIDPLVEDMIREEARFANAPIRDVSTQDMQHRLALAMVHEGTLMLADRTAGCAADINMASICGFGFPKACGGVLGWADAKGATWINETLNALAQDDILWTPGQVISDCAQRQSRFADWRI